MVYIFRWSYLTFGQADFTKWLLLQFGFPQLFPFRTLVYLLPSFPINLSGSLFHWLIKEWHSQYITLSLLRVSQKSSTHPLSLQPSNCFSSASTSAIISLHFVFKYSSIVISISTPIPIQTETKGARILCAIVTLWGNHVLKYLNNQNI